MISASWSPAFLRDPSALRNALPGCHHRRCPPKCSIRSTFPPHNGLSACKSHPRSSSRLCSALRCPWLAPAQEAAAKKAAQGAAKPAAEAAEPTQTRAEFDRVYGQWKELIAALADLRDKYQNASDEEKAAIEKQYKDEAAKGDRLSVRLKAVTEAAFAADPADKDVVQLLTVMAFTALRDDNYEEVDRLRAR